jgi:hypothetical protein
MFLTRCRRLPEDPQQVSPDAVAPRGPAHTPASRLPPSSSHLCTRTGQLKARPSHSKRELRRGSGAPRCASTQQRWCELVREAQRSATGRRGERLAGPSPLRTLTCSRQRSAHYNTLYWSKHGTGGKAAQRTSVVSICAARQRGSRLPPLGRPLPPALLPGCHTLTWMKACSAGGWQCPAGSPPTPTQLTVVSPTAANSSGAGGPPLLALSPPARCSCMARAKSLPPLGRKPSSSTDSPSAAASPSSENTNARTQPPLAPSCSSSGCPPACGGPSGL